MFSPWKKIDSETKATVIRWAYLVIVVAASITMAFLLYENRLIVNDIQNDRKQVAYNLCLEQNAKNDNLIIFLKEEDALTPVTQRFVNTLAPKQDCEQLIINLFGSPIENEHNK